MTRLMQILVAALALFAGLAFHAKNGAAVTLDLYVWRITAPLSLVAVSALIAGAALAALVMSWRLFVLKREIGRLRRRLAGVEPPSTTVVPVRHGS